MRRAHDKECQFLTIAAPADSNLRRPTALGRFFSPENHLKINEMPLIDALGTALAWISPPAVAVV